MCPTTLYTIAMQFGVYSHTSVGTAVEVTTINKPAQLCTFQQTSPRLQELVHFDNER